ncbi:MAG: hypothetical protein AB1641_19335 [Thermodesulfobacteriota bacterium]
MVRLDLTSLETYSRSCLEIARARLGSFSSLAEIAAAEADLNAYEHLEALSEPRDIHLLEEDRLAPADLDRARQAVLEGRIFWEHTAAGEATRLRMGTKYRINVPEHLTVKMIAATISDELRREVSPQEVRAMLAVDPKDLLPLSLGRRHLLQLAFDLTRLAEEAGQDPRAVLARQKILLILNEKTAETITARVRKADFMGFDRLNFYFMIQPTFLGIALRDGRFFFDPASPRRMHNHGQLVMQETMDDQVYYLDEFDRCVHLSAEEFEDLLAESSGKISYNIEDLDYLTGAVDYPALALALRLGEKGFNMVMEIVANNPERPMKGGLAAYDLVLGRNVMIESFQLKGWSNDRIKFLNRNFNHYTNPVVGWRAIKERGLPMPVAVKEGYLYFQPVQGDINFLVPTALVRRGKLKPIKAWKSAADSPQAVNAMWAQDNQPGFKEFVKKTIGDLG